MRNNFFSLLCQGKVLGTKRLQSIFIYYQKHSATYIEIRGQKNIVTDTILNTKPQSKQPEAPITMPNNSKIFHAYYLLSSFTTLFILVSNIQEVVKALPKTLPHWKESQNIDQGQFELSLPRVAVSTDKTNKL